MTTNHMFYIPLVLFVGLVLGLVLGRRSVIAQQEEEARLAARRAARHQPPADRPSATDGVPSDGAESAPR